MTTGSTADRVSARVKGGKPIRQARESVGIGSACSHFFKRSISLLDSVRVNIQKLPPVALNPSGATRRPLCKSVFASMEGAIPTPRPAAAAFKIWPSQSNHLIEQTASRLIALATPLRPGIWPRRCAKPYETFSRTIQRPQITSYGYMLVGRVLPSRVLLHLINHKTRLNDHR